MTAFLQPPPPHTPAHPFLAALKILLRGGGGVLTSRHGAKPRMRNAEEAEVLGEKGRIFPSSRLSQAQTVQQSFSFHLLGVSWSQEHPTLISY